MWSSGGADANQTSVINTSRIGQKRSASRPDFVNVSCVLAWRAWKHSERISGCLGTLIAHEGCFRPASQGHQENQDLLKLYLNTLTVKFKNIETVVILRWN
jgi:hypothetical protein